MQPTTNLKRLNNFRREFIFFNRSNSNKLQKENRVLKLEPSKAKDTTRP
jgi:hypothetical protein